MNNKVLDERLKQIFIDLTLIDAVSGNEAPVATYIKNFIKEFSLKVFTDDANELSNGNSGNVIVEILGGGEYLLASHMDTPRSTAKLNHQFLSDRITSDGTTPLGVDDRGGLSSILFALEKAVKNGTLKPCTLLFTVCEETTLAGSIYYNPNPKIKYGFIFDSHMSPGNFVSETCGAINFDFIIRGVSSHAGISPEKGINAIKVAAEAMTKFPFGRIDEKTMSGIISDFNQVCTKYGAKMEAKYFWDFLPYYIKESDFPFTHFVKTAKKLGLTPASKKSMGGSDANSLNAKGIKAINIGVGAQNPHGNDEFILYKDLQAASDIAYQLLTTEIN